jgi:hypothetical protein
VRYKPAILGVTFGVTEVARIELPPWNGVRDQRVRTARKRTSRKVRFVRGAGPVVELYGDRIEVTNPGNSLIEVDRINDERRSRKQKFAAALREIGPRPAQAFRSGPRWHNQCSYSPRNLPAQVIQILKTRFSRLRVHRIREVGYAFLDAQTGLGSSQFRSHPARRHEQ